MQLMNMEGNSDMAIDEKKHRIIWLDEYCEYCGEQLNSWDKRVAKVLYFNFHICERCMAEEYGMTKDYLRSRMLERFGMKPCEGL